jgi:D,D-heptose 1,7-bisphosphate phosphatase
VLNQAVFLLDGEFRAEKPGRHRSEVPWRSIGGVPFLARLMGEVARHGVEDMIVIGADAERWGEFFAECSERAYNVRVLPAAGEAGALHALRGAADMLHERFFLVDGGSFFDINLPDLARHAAPFSVLLAVRAAAEGPAWMVSPGATEFADEGGVRVVEKAILDEFEGAPHNALPRLIGEGRVGAMAFHKRFWDGAAPDSLESPQRSLSEHLRRPALFLDRDGVINIDTGFPHRPDQIEWVEGALDAIRLANDCGYLVIVVTNQGGVARGLYAEEDVIALHRWMQQRFAEVGAHVDQFRYCPHYPDGAVPRYSRHCDCRKPSPGMLLAALSGDIRAESSLLIGDRASDLEAAHRAGIAGHLFTGGNVRDFIAPLLIDWSGEPASFR